MNEFSRLIAAGTILGVPVVIVMLLWNAIFPPPPPTAEQVWIRQQVERCQSMRSNLNYDEATKKAECWRTPFMRQPKKMFTAVFEK